MLAVFVPDKRRNVAVDFSGATHHDIRLTDTQNEVSAARVVAFRSEITHIEDCCPYLCVLAVATAQNLLSLRQQR